MGNLKQSEAWSNHKNFEAGLKENQKDIVSVDQNRTKYAGKGFKGSNLVNPLQW